MGKVVKQIIYNVPGVKNTKDDLTSGNLFSGENVIKLGVQAPTGTKFKINTTDQDANVIECLMGKTGLYELDEDNLIIKYLSFVQQFEKTFNGDKTKAYITIGKEIIDTAIQNRTYRFNYTNYEDSTYNTTTTKKVVDDEQKVIAESDKYCKILDTITDETNKDNKRDLSAVSETEKIKIENLYYNEYMLGYKYIFQAENGVYDENTQQPIQLKNIIIDYVVEEVNA